MEIKVTKDNFKQEVLESSMPVLIDFWATWCGPCRNLLPVIDEVAKELKGEAKVCKINVDEQPELARAFNVFSVPTLAVVENGKVKTTKVGSMPKEKLIELVR